MTDERQNPESEIEQPAPKLIEKVNGLVKLLLVALLLASLGVIVTAIVQWAFRPYSAPEGTGFVYTNQDSDLERYRTLWDWLGLLIVPLAVAAGAAFISYVQKRTELDVAAKARKSEQQIATDRLRQTTLEGYYDRMTELLLEHGLRGSSEDSEARSIARARTVAVVKGLDGERNGQLFAFLRTSRLIEKEAPIVDLRGADLSKADLSGVDLIETNLSEVNLSGADLSLAHLSFANLNLADLSRANLQGAWLSHANLIEANLSLVNLGGTDLRAANLSLAYLEEASLRNANLEGAALRGARLERVNLSEARLGRADLSEADLFKATVRTAYLIDANLSSVNLSGVDLSGASLRGVNLHWANLHETILSGADLSLADLRGGHLSWADLSRANLNRADLRDATLNRAFLINADLSWADLRGAKEWKIAQFDSAKTLAGTTMPDGVKLRGDDNPNGPTYDEWKATVTKVRNQE